MTTALSLYFAYGSNMDLAQMSHRCPGATPRSSANLDGYRFIINSRGVATILALPRAQVYGLLWSVSEAHLRKLDRYEGVHEGFYSRTKLQLHAIDGNFTGWVYIAKDTTVGRPRPGYLEGIIAAARAAGLPADYIKELEGAA